MDFQPEARRLENITNLADHASHTTDAAQGSLITFDPNDSILVINRHHLTSGDFIFT
jgi:hypothetical protein